ncbi:Protein N-terminal amidase [Candida viswanathii]|uniref:Protein N-terminal amidase n=1 Tax=Candida viswanathii TaxID=5486 RepID=A0A367XM82_9ASCO|nr:Protein N-terminal amidase [Candida viswanathii]
MKIRIALLQLNPRIGHINTNISNVKTLLQKITSPVDLIVLPELAITGYNFSDPAHIKPYLESTTKYGPSLSLAQEISQQFKCLTFIGYPETSDETTYNSCAVFDGSGDLIYNYRKTFLYETDEKWGSSENPVRGFPGLQLEFSKNGETKSVISNVGICMDLNPYKFEAPFNKFEFSLSSYAQKARLLICPMNWLHPKSPSLKTELPFAKRVELAENLQLEDEPEASTVNYWVLRLFPYVNHEYSIAPKWFHGDEKVTAVCCNRVGAEDDVVYGGSSSIIQFGNNGVYTDDSTGIDNANVDLVGSLSQQKEDILIREVDI